MGHTDQGRLTTISKSNLKKVSGPELCEWDPEYQFMILPVVRSIFIKLRLSLLLLDCSNTVPV